MNVEIINVGTELLLGEITNTNAVRLFALCKELGFHVYYQSVVGDNSERLFNALTTAFARGADCVMTTGGLGPTQDDLTKELSAAYFGLPLILYEEELKKVKEKCAFLVTDDLVTQNNYKQAYFPADAVILENPVGTANGCVMFHDHQMIINLPGPPKELNYMIDHSLRQYLQPLADERLYTTDLITMGLGESRVDTLLSDLEEGQEEVSLAMYAGEGKVRIRLGVQAVSRQEADAKMAPLKQEISRRLADYLLADDSIYTALNKMMPTITYDGDLMLPSFLKPYVSSQASLHIQTRINHQRLGDEIFMTINDDQTYRIAMLGDYRHSISWLEARMALFIYRYLEEKKS